MIRCTSGHPTQLEQEHFHIQFSIGKRKQNKINAFDSRALHRNNIVVLRYCDIYKATQRRQQPTSTQPLPLMRLHCTKHKTYKFNEYTLRMAITSSRTHKYLWIKYFIIFSAVDIFGVVFYFMWITTWKHFVVVAMLIWIFYIILLDVFFLPFVYFDFLCCGASYGNFEYKFRHLHVLIINALHMRRCSGWSRVPSSQTINDNKYRNQNIERFFIYFLSEVWCSQCSWVMTNTSFQRIYTSIWSWSWSTYTFEMKMKYGF